METPTITKSAYSSKAIDYSSLMPVPDAFLHEASAVLDCFGNTAEVERRPRRIQAVLKPTKERPMTTPTLRIVQVYIADTNENIPLEKRLIYSGEQKLTDLTDQELFFEVDIKTLLEKHNAERVKMLNKAVKERTEYLEPVRIRDLKMTVVDVAVF